MNYETQLPLLIKTAINAADPAPLVAKHLKQTTNGTLIGDTLYPETAVTLISVGKAAVSMAQAAAIQLESRLRTGIVISKAAKAADLPDTLHYYQASHPIPDERSLAATTAVKSLLATTTTDELVLCLISGGTSALLTDPSLPLPHWRQLNQALLASGCTINEVNTVRQRFDAVKGGGLLQWAAPASCVSLILSDVIGNNLAHIGSGPTILAEKDNKAVAAILDEHKVWNWLNSETADLIKKQLKLPLPTLKLALKDSQALIIGDISTATAAVAQKTAEWGLETRIVSNELTGEARQIGQMTGQKAREIAPNHCLIWGGESTVRLQGNGRGGRNQEIALAAALAIEGVPGCVVAAFSTDAEDGPTPVAGAFVTSKTAVLAREKGLDPAEFLDNNDSYTFFEQLGTGHLTAAAGTNVNDLLVLIKR